MNPPGPVTGAVVASSPADAGAGAPTGVGTGPATTAASPARTGTDLTSGIDQSDGYDGYDGYDWWQRRHCDGGHNCGRSFSGAADERTEKAESKDDG